MPAVHCRDCGRLFDNDGYAWKTRCLDCYIDHKQGQEERQARAQTGGQYLGRGELLQIVTELTNDVETLQRKLTAAEQENLRLRLDKTKSRPSNGAIPEDLLKRMIRLCHPDRHDNSPSANTVTQWLLKQR